MIFLIKAVSAIIADVISRTRNPSAVTKIPVNAIEPPTYVDSSGDTEKPNPAEAIVIRNLESKGLSLLLSNTKADAAKMAM